MISFCCVIVLYKMRLEESPSFRSVYAQAKRQTRAKIGFFICDNSPMADNKRSEYPDVHYEHHPENKGLGYAYNAAARYSRQKGLEWLILLDQDTILSDDFLACYAETLPIHPEVELFASQIFLPSKKELSPLRRWKAQKRSLQPDKLYLLKHYLLINSGLCIKLALFERSGGYDERVWLDFADTQFIRRIMRIGIEQFYLLPCFCVQNFSNEETELEKLKSRFDIYLQCARACRYFHFSDWLCGQYGIILHTISLCRRTRSLFFLKRLFIRYVFREQL